MRARARGRGRRAAREAGVHCRRGRLLDQLLVAALDRAVALAELDDVAVRVAEDLDLDVARVGEVALQVDRAVAEEALPLAARGVERAAARPRGRDAEADPAAAAGGLHRDRVADLRGHACAVVELSTAPCCPARRARRAARESARARLLAHRLDRLRRRADEDDARVGTAPREGRVLGEEAVAGMERVAAVPPARLEHRVDVEVALGGGRRPDRTASSASRTCRASGSASE